MSINSRLKLNFRVQFEALSVDGELCVLKQCETFMKISSFTTAIGIMFQREVASSKYLFSYFGAIYWLGQKALVGIDLINLNNSDDKFSRDFA